MKHASRLLRPCGLLLVAVLLTPAVEAATRTKANNNTNLNVAGSWDALPGVNDIARWNSTVTAATAGNPFPLGGDVSWLGIQIVNPGAAVTITGAQTLTLGGPGVNVSSYPSGASIDMSTATQDLTIGANLRLLANSGQIWNVQTGRVLTLNGTTFTRSAGATLNIVGAGTVATTNISNEAATGLIGAWASHGTGTATRYATISGGNIVAYTGGTAAATAADVTATNGTENYDVAAVTGPLGAGASINTLRYTGAAGTIAGNLEVNGLMNAGAGTLTMNGNITIGGSRELVANSTVGLTLSGTISDNAGGASGVTKSGNGTLTLSGDNDYTGATVVSRGVLAISHANALGATGVGAGTTVYTAPGGRLQLSNNITVSEEITFVSGDPNSTNSTGLYNASGNNTLLGQLKPVDQLRMGGAGGAILNIRGGVTGTNTFFVLNPGGGTFSFTDQPVAIGAGGSFYLDQGGTILLGVTGNSFGRTLVAGGTMRMGVAGALPSTTSKIEVGVGYSPNGTLDLDGYSQTAVELKSGSFRSPATRLITSATAATLTINQPTNTTYDGRITGAVALTKSGAGTLTLQGDNANTGDTVISGGALLIHNVTTSGQTGNYSTTLNSANATISGLSTANLVVGQAISGSGIPAGAFISGITNATTVSVTLPANAGATGTTSTAVTFAALNGSLAGSTVNYDNQGGLLRFGYSTTSTTLGGLKGDQNLSLLNTNAAPAGVALSVGANHQSTTYTGDLTGAGGALNKVGTGTLALGGANTYTGATTVTDGTLLIDGSLNGTSLVDVNGGTLGGIGTITGSIDVANGAALQGGDGVTAADDLQIAGDVSLAGNSVIKLTLGAGLTHSTLARTSGAWVFGSDLAFTFADAGAEVGTYENLITGLTDSVTGLGDIGTWTITNAGYAGTFSFDGANVDLTVTSVPEPGTVVSLCGGLGLLLGLRRRRAKR